MLDCNWPKRSHICWRDVVSFLRVVGEGHVRTCMLCYQSYARDFWPDGASLWVGHRLLPCWCGPCYKSTNTPGLLFSAWRCGKPPPCHARYWPHIPHERLAARLHRWAWFSDWSNASLDIFIRLFSGILVACIYRNGRCCPVVPISADLLSYTLECLCRCDRGRHRPKVSAGIDMSSLLKSPVIIQLAFR